MSVSSFTITRQHLLSAPELVNRCYSRLRETADGGDACMDKGGLVAGVGSLRLTPAVTGFPAWYRDPDSTGDEPGPRGDAAWLWPTGESTGASAQRRPGGPRILFLHGGGYTSYSPWSPGCIRVASKLALFAGMPVLSIDYRMVPEYRFPCPTEDALQALRWLLDPANDPAPGSPGRSAGCTTAASPTVFVCGDSAGGGLAVLAAIEAGKADDLRGKVAGLGLFSPYTDLAATLPSYVTRAWDPAAGTAGSGDPVFSSGDGSKDAEATRRLTSAMIPTGWTLEDPRASPVFSAELGALPRCRIHVGDAEVMLSEATALAERATAAGAAEVTALVWDRMWHDFVYYGDGCIYRPGETDAPLLEADAAIRDVADTFAAWAGA